MSVSETEKQPSAVDAALAAFYPGQTIHEVNRPSLERRMAAALEAAALSPAQGEAGKVEKERMTAVYSEGAIARARDGALDWLEGNSGGGFPRSWDQESKNQERRGYAIYELDFEAPPIAGYEALEREGLAVRGETIVTHDGQERVCFKLAECKVIEQIAVEPK